MAFTSASKAQRTPVAAEKMPNICLLEFLKIPPIPLLPVFPNEEPSTLNLSTPSGGGYHIAIQGGGAKLGSLIASKFNTKSVIAYR